KAMIEKLLSDHQHLAKTAHNLFKNAQSDNDDVTADLDTQRMTVHEKTAWMLGSLLAE
ncbi:MAG: DNA starvation/stationary phase protection protein, partial [Deltaproteobacteria bacterium]|nr:DNA starvation/stationary phase protection protein [Deltaproteobacteria bacterium]